MGIFTYGFCVDEEENSVCLKIRMWGIGTIDEDRFGVLDISSDSLVKPWTWTVNVLEEYRCDFSSSFEHVQH